MTTFIRASGIITNPDPTLPQFVDFDTSVLLDFNAESLLLSDGDTVDMWAADKYASDVSGHRVLSYVTSGLSKPKFVIDSGAAAVSFEGLNSIRNNGATPQAPMPEGYTVAMVCKDIQANHEVGYISGARLWGACRSGSPGMPIAVAGIRAQNDRFYSMPATSTDLGPIPSGEFVIASSVDGANSHVAFSGFEGANCDFSDTGGYNGISLGYRMGDFLAADSSITGLIKRVIVYRGAFSLATLQNLVYKLELEYGL